MPISLAYLSTSSRKSTATPTSWKPSSACWCCSSSQQRNFAPAGRTPGRPEVHDHRLARPAADRALRAFEIQQREVGQRLGDLPLRRTSAARRRRGASATAVRPTRCEPRRDAELINAEARASREQRDGDVEPRFHLHWRPAPPNTALLAIQLSARPAARLRESGLRRGRGIDPRARILPA